MTEETTDSAESQDVLKIKHPEPRVSRDEPWQDDVLDRAKIAEKLTNLFREQRDPFVISIDGQWGTGKTFLLERWQRDLEREGFSAIYFNAWEDDFCDDPLLAIIGQLSEQFKKGKFKELAEQVGQIAVQLIKQNLIAVPSKLTGLDLSVDVSKLNDRDLLQEYSDQRKTKDRLKNKLAQLSDKVAEETGHPLVFIIDELDRCRPTFAIELLERVKHIFDIPNMVFVFGINRDELCKSLNSIYGEIDTTVYLRRFFDMEFRLPEADSANFCRSLMDRFHFEEFFRTSSTNANTTSHSNEYYSLARCFSVLCGSLGLSLRDIDFCVRLIALVGKNIEEQNHMYPGLLSLLILLKLKNPTLYRQFIRGECRASAVMDYIDQAVSIPTGDSQLDFPLRTVEASLYFAEIKRLEGSGESSALEQLRLLQTDSKLTHPEFLSERARSADAERASELSGLIESYFRHYWSAPRSVLDYVAEFIDLHSFVRR
jgi:hypothetical protein